MSNDLKNLLDRGVGNPTIRKEIEACIAAIGNEAVKEYERLILPQKIRDASYCGAKSAEQNAIRVVRAYEGKTGTDRTQSIISTMMKLSWKD